MARLEQIDKLEMFFDICTHRLFSYYYHPKVDDKEIHEYKDRGVHLFLDSGAFTAFTKKKEIDIELYARYINTNNFFYPVANLDDIGDDGPKSYANMCRLIELVGPDIIMPVFHYSDKMEWLFKLLEEGHKYIALGGLVGASWQVLQPWLDTVWQHLVDKDGKPLLKVHGFGLTTVKAMTSYPWYSVDSSSWMQSAIYGSGMFVRPGGRVVKVIFSEENPDKRNLNGWHFQTLPAPLKEEVRSWLEPFDMTPEQCGEYWGYRCVVNARAYMDLGKHLASETFKRAQEVLF